MKNHNQYIDVSKLDKLIEEKYSASYMSNNKWFKLIETLTTNLNSVYFDYKLIHSDEIDGDIFITTDFEPFFIEPILYKEVEWIEFPAIYEHWVNENNRKAGKKTFNQELKRIHSEINKIGEFELESDDNSIKLYGYK